MARQRRLAAQAAAASIRTPTPLLPEPSDDEMADAPPPETAAQQAEDEDDDDEAEADQEDDRATTPPRDSQTPSRSNTPRRSGRASAIPPRKRRLGRPPKVRPQGDEEEKNEATSDAGTPKKRGGFRGHRGGRWGKRGGGPSHVTQVPIDKEGNMMDVVEDEVVTPEDPEGEKKVDKFGHLQDGREYRVRTFTILGRGRRLYMLSTEPARCIGFRDSYLFFQKHRFLYKIIIDDEEKRDLIERSLIPHSYKGRAIGVVTARSVFREFGAKIIIGGKKVTDEYHTLAALGRGDIEGELEVPDDKLPLPGEPYNRNQYVAWHGASSVYHSGQPSVPLPSGKIIDGKRRKVTVTSDNWMLEHAREASRFNSLLSMSRNENNNGCYDIHTNSIQWPSATQPTHARWEAVEIAKDGKHGRGQTGCSQTEEDAVADLSSRFESLDPVYPRNFMIHDLCLLGTPEPDAGPPGIDHNPQKLSNLSAEILDELPPGCRQALEDSNRSRLEWSSHWHTETTDGKRGTFTSTVEWFP